jgi:hypothetical protein
MSPPPIETPPDKPWLVPGARVALPRLCRQGKAKGAVWEVVRCYRSDVPGGFMVKLRALTYERKEPMRVHPEWCDPVATT